MQNKPENEGDTPQPPRRKAWVRVVSVAAVMLTAWQILASFLWIAPYSANAREIVPGNALASYMLPFFGQSWSVFAPEPINGDYHFNVRASFRGSSGELIETGWVSATDVELSMIRYNLAPPRAGIQSSEVASSLKAAYDVLDDAQKTIVQASFDTRDEFQVLLESTAGQNESVDLTVSEKRIASFLEADLVATAYATQVAYAIWGAEADELESVQYRVSRQNIVPFAQRHNPDAQRPAPVVVLPGWHELVVEQGQNQEAFTKVFRAQFERLQG